MPHIPVVNSLQSLAKSLGVPVYRMTDRLQTNERCPHCSTPHPGFTMLFRTGVLKPANGGPEYDWAGYSCNSCAGMMLAKAGLGETGVGARIDTFFPSARQVHDDIPLPARKFLEQAVSTLHAPDAAAMMAGSAVDSMLKILGYEDGSVYTRIDSAVKDHAITKAMGEWAHAVRLGSNRPRHADLDKPHVSPEEAQQSVDFAEALGFFLFVLTSRIERGREAAAGSLIKKEE